MAEGELRYVDSLPAWPGTYLPADDPRVLSVRGIVIHDPEASSPEGLWATYRQTGLLPHYSVVRDGTIWRHLDPDAGRTFHVREADRWWPVWLLPNRDLLPVSAVNRQCVGIEVLSGARYRREEESYTPMQYKATAQLCQVLWLRVGKVPIVGHGALQLDRSDPVAWRWEHFWQLMGREWVSDDAMLERLAQRVRDLEQDQTRCNAVKAEFERWLRDREGKRPRVCVGLTDLLIRRGLQGLE